MIILDHCAFKQSHKARVAYHSLVVAVTEENVSITFRSEQIKHLIRKQLKQQCQAC